VVFAAPYSTVPPAPVALGSGVPLAEVHPPDLQPGHFTESNPGVRQQVDGVAVLPRCLGEPLGRVPVQ
jgi:hypothetical protein